MAGHNRNTTDFDSTADGPDADPCRESPPLAAINALVRTAGQRALDHPTGDRKRAATAAPISSSDPASFDNGEFSSDNLSATWTNDLPARQVNYQRSWAPSIFGRSASSTTYDPSFSGQSEQLCAWSAAGGRASLATPGPHQFQANLRPPVLRRWREQPVRFLAYGYKISHAALRVTAQLSNAFRAPSFNDLYFPFFGNSELEPERASQRRARAAVCRAADANLRAAACSGPTRATLIVFDPAALRVQRTSTKARVTGFELARRPGAAAAWSASRRTGRCCAPSTRRPERSCCGARPGSSTPRATYALGVVERGRRSLTVVGPRDDLDINTFQRVRARAATRSSRLRCRRGACRPAT